AGPMHTDEGLGTDDRDNLQDRWKPSIQLDEEQAIIVREPDPHTDLTAQHSQLPSEGCILCCKAPVRLKRRGQDGQSKKIAARSSRCCILSLTSWSRHLSRRGD